jgi:hypothetical protein
LRSFGYEQFIETTQTGQFALRRRQSLGSYSQLVHVENAIGGNVMRIKHLTVLAFLSLVIQASIQPAEGREEGFAKQFGVGINAPTRSQGKISILSFDAQSLPGEIRHQGKIVNGARWIDSNGENFLLLTQTGKIPSKGKSAAEEEDNFDAEIYAYNYVKKDDKVSLLWKITDFERKCSFDLYAGFLKGALFITDLDSNGVAESLFLYKLSCRSDVSPATLKLIMHEGVTKYAIRGTTKLPGDGGGGEMNIDAAFKAAKPVLREFAVENWKKYVTKDEFEQF